MSSIKAGNFGNIRKTKTYPKATAENGMKSFIDAHSIWLTYYATYAPSMKNATKTSATVAGRACDKFNFSAAALGAGERLNMVHAEYACYVDKETSICLKWEYSATVDGKTQSWSLTCVEFDGNPTFVLPTVSEANTTVVGVPSNQGGENGNAQGNQGGSEQGQGNQGENDNGQGSGNQGGSEQGQGTDTGNQGNQGASTVYTITLAARASILSTIGDTYKVVAAGLFDGYPTTVASDGTYFYASAPYESFNKKIGETYLYLYGYMWDGKYHKMGTPTYSQDGQPHTMLGRGAVGNMFQFAGEELSYNTVESITYLQRSAKNYTFESTNAYGYNVLFHEEVVIDDLTGACLYYQNYGRSSDGFVGGTRNKVAFEVTEFSYGTGNASARAFLDDYIDKIDVFEWDAAFIKAVGLLAVSAPNGELWFSEWED